MGKDVKILFTILGKTKHGARGGCPKFVEKGLNP